MEENYIILNNHKTNGLQSIELKIDPYGERAVYAELGMVLSQLDIKLGKYQIKSVKEKETDHFYTVKVTNTETGEEIKNVSNVYADLKTIEIKQADEIW